MQLNFVFHLFLWIHGCMCILAVIIKSNARSISIRCPTQTRTLYQINILDVLHQFKERYIRSRDRHHGLTPT